MKPGETARPSASMVRVRRAADLADFDDLAVLDPDIAAKCRHPRAIDDAAIIDQQVIRHLGRLSRLSEPPTAALPLEEQRSRLGIEGKRDRDCVVYRFAVWTPMIRSFGDKRTKALFDDAVVRDFATVARRAKRKLEAIHAAIRLDDLMVPPSNRLEKLRGNLREFQPIRVNDQWRVIFRWRDGDAFDVRIVDYH